MRKYSSSTELFRLSWSLFVPFILLLSFYPSVNCVETKANLNLTSCVLTVNKNVYNLSSLIRNDGDQPWQLNTRMQLSELTSKHVFINLCRPLPKTAPTLPFGGCGDSVNSSICIIDSKANETVSLGDYNNITASFDEDNIEAIHITMKDSNSKSSTDIYLHCNPSLTNNQPVLTQFKSNRLVFEWYDASACPKAEVIGDDCSVYVPSISKVFDLSPLRRDGGYDFPEQGYDYFINVCGPINRKGCNSDSGICHYSKDGKMTYSLGKWNDQVTYSDGIIKLTYGDGDPYRNFERTPRVTQILFICNNSVADGKPDFIEETNRTYIIHWETKYACPKITHNVDCLWQNSTHRVDLNPFSKSEGNFMVPLLNGIIIINACSPVNPKIHRLPKCPYSSGVCFIPTTSLKDDSKPKSINLGQPKTKPQLLFDNQINLIYTDGDQCQSDPSKRYLTRITFSCDRNVGEGEPTLIRGDPSNCEWLFEWKTSLVCQARPIYSHQCIFEDQLNKLKVDLTQVFSSLPPISEQNNSTIKTFFINICSTGMGKDYKGMTISKMCSDSSICVEETLISEDNPPHYISLGNLKSNNSEYFFQGESLILRFFNGSLCDTSSWSSEIDIRCSSNPKTTFIRRETDKCIHKIYLESSLVCGLKPASCTYRFNDSIIDLRKLSSLTHAWKTNVPNDDRVYYFNLCNKIPKGHTAYDGISSVVECDIVEGVEHCGNPLGQKDLMTMSMEYHGDKKNLLITYLDEKSKVCVDHDNVTTKIKLICSPIHREPKFIRKIDNKTSCEYHFEWETYSACFDHEKERMGRKLDRIGEYFIDSRPELSIDMAINMSDIFRSPFVVTGGRYNYTINLSGSHVNNKSQGYCANAGVCQRELNGTLERDIGSLGTETMITQGTKIILELVSINHQKCGKNDEKNVTTTIYFQCSTAESGIGSPKFFYESNDCDYIFLWDTDIVCPGKMLSAPDLKAKLLEKTNDQSGDFFGQNSSVSASIFGALFVLTCLILFAVVPAIFLVSRLVDPEKRNYLVHWIRSKFRAPVITSFHYSQVSSDSTKLVSINDDL